MAGGDLPWWRQVASLVGFLAMSWGVSLLGSLPIRANSGGWYALAEKAPWTPPAWIFGSVWLLLYAAMAMATWLVWRQRDVPRRDTLRTYGGLLLLGRRGR